MANPTLTDVTGVGPAGATRLRRAGFRTVEALAAADLDEIVAVPGFGPATAAAVSASARDLAGPPRREPAAEDGDGSDRETKAEDAETAATTQRDKTKDKKKTGKKKTGKKKTGKKKTGKKKTGKKDKRGKKDKKDKKGKKATKDEKRRKAKRGRT